MFIAQKAPQLAPENRSSRPSLMVEEATAGIATPQFSHRRLLRVMLI
jgi:hypothetical protein